MHKLLTFLFIFTTGFSSLFAQQTQNVFIVVIDGARYSETFGDPIHQYIPQIWNQLKPLGTICPSFYNNSVTQTNPGHSSILTGTWQTIANDGTELPHKPTIFEYFRKEYGTPQDQNYVILGKDKLDILAYSDYSGYGASYGASVKTSTSQYDDITTLSNVKTVINASHPRLAIVNFSGTDRAGHDGPWSNYTTKLRIADSLTSVLWNYIQTDLVYKNKTTMIITNDHGRHLDGVADGFRGHGDDCDGCRHIGLLVIGPDTPAGITDVTTWEQIDIAPTVGLLLKFGTPYSIGSVINSAAIFEGIKTVSAQIFQNWNLLSVPLGVSNYFKDMIFSGSISTAFKFIPNVGYQPVDTLKNGTGYWLKFAADQNKSMTGYTIKNDTVEVISGWNLIGSISVSVLASGITTLPPEILSSQFYGYNNGYIISDIIEPLKGYWIKVNQNGKLILKK